jgi:site-specific DNA-cytosine methylase
MAKGMRTVYVDLFSGIGGFALGAKWAALRFDRHYFSEIDSYAVEVYKKRFPEAVSLGDIKKIDWRELCEKENEEEPARFMLAGGFP